MKLVEHLKDKLDNGLLSVLDGYRSVLNKLSHFDLQAARGGQVRSRVRWVEDGEISSADFFHLEKKRSADRWISALRETDGTFISNPYDLSFFCFFLF